MNGNSLGDFKTLEFEGIKSGATAESPPKGVGVLDTFP